MTLPALSSALAIAGLMFCSCASTESKKNTAAGADHYLAQRLHPQEWPAAGVDRGSPRGLLFAAQGHARATLLCLHGIQTHAGWFEPLAGRLTAEGFNVIAMDRRGSGVNTTEPFVKGYAENPDELLHDLEAQLAAARALGGRFTSSVPRGRRTSLRCTRCATCSRDRPALCSWSRRPVVASRASPRRLRRIWAAGFSLAAR